MPFVKANIQTKTYKNSDQVENSDFAVDKFDCFLNDLKHFQKRPGLAEWFRIVGVGNVNGLYEWKEKNVCLAVANGNLYSITEFGSVTKLTTTDILLSNQRAYFAEAKASGSSVIIVANGSKMVKTDNSTAVYVGKILTEVTHVDYLDGYTLALNDNKVYYSSVNDPLTWSSLSFFTASSDADKTIAMKVFLREVNLFGKRTLDPYRNNGLSPFSRLPGAFTQTGIIAKDSVVQANNKLFWLSEGKRFVHLSGRSAVSVSGAFDKEIQKLDTVDDCIADNIEVAGKAFIMLTFPTENKTFVYDYGQKDWYEWGYYDTANNKRGRMLINSYVFMSAWNIYLVGSSKDGKIYKFTFDETTDDGREIAYEVVSGHLDYKTRRRKRSLRSIVACLTGKIGWESQARLYKVLQSSLTLNEVQNAVDVTRVGVDKTKSFTLQERTKTAWQYGTVAEYSSVDLSLVNNDNLLVHMVLVPDTANTTNDGAGYIWDDSVTRGGIAYNFRIVATYSSGTTIITAQMKHAVITISCATSTSSPVTWAAGEAVVLDVFYRGANNNSGHQIDIFINGELKSATYSDSTAWVDAKLASGSILGALTAPTIGNYKGGIYDASWFNLLELRNNNFTDLQIAEALYENKYGGTIYRFVEEFGQTLNNAQTLMYSHLDNNIDQSSEKQVSLGKIGKTDPTKKFFNGGVYRTRQHRFRVTDPIKFTLLELEEDVLLGNG